MMLECMYTTFYARVKNKGKMSGSEAAREILNKKWVLASENFLDAENVVVGLVVFVECLSIWLKKEI